MREILREPLLTDLLPRLALTSVYFLRLTFTVTFINLKSFVNELKELLLVLTAVVSHQLSVFLKVQQRNLVLLGADPNSCLKKLTNRGFKGVLELKFVDSVIYPQNPNKMIFPNQIFLHLIQLFNNKTIKSSHLKIFIEKFHQNDSNDSPRAACRLIALILNFQSM